MAKYGQRELEQLWIDAGGPPRVAAVMARLALRESGGNPRAANTTANTNGTRDDGLWQVNSVHGYDPGYLHNPMNNAKAAVKVYKSQGLKAWSTYNAATDDKYIGKGASALMKRRGEQRGDTTYRTETIPGDVVQDKLGALRASLLEGNKNVLLRANSLLQSGLYTTQTPSRQRSVASQFSGSAPSGRGQGHPGVIVKPGANRKGVGLTPAILHQVQLVSEVFGGKLTIGTGTNHDRLTTTGNVSDHWSGNGADIPALGARLTRLGQAALIAAGMPEKQARKTHGGAFTLHHNGKRIQVIFNSNIGGNHYNHLHVGVG